MGWNPEDVANCPLGAVLSIAEGMDGYLVKVSTEHAGVGLMACYASYSDEGCEPIRYVCRWYDLGEVAEAISWIALNAPRNGACW